MTPEVQLIALFSVMLSFVSCLLTFWGFGLLYTTYRGMSLPILCCAMVLVAANVWMTMHFLALMFAAFMCLFGALLAGAVRFIVLHMEATMFDEFIRQIKAQAMDRLRGTEARP